MKFDIGILQMAEALARHSTSRQTVLAQNVANADTQGYKARDVSSFAETYSDKLRRSDWTGPQRAGHLALESISNEVRTFETAGGSAESPNGNTVSVEDQMVRAAEVRNRHDLALGIYGKSIDILRAGMGRVR